MVAQFYSRELFILNIDMTACNHRLKCLLLVMQVSRPVPDILTLRISRRRFDILHKNKK